MSIAPYIFLAVVILIIVAFFIGWGVSLVWRAMTYARGRDGRRSCPSCNEDMRGLSTLTCPTCQNTALSEIDLQACKPIRPALVGGIVSIAFSMVFLFASWYIILEESGFQYSIFGARSVVFLCASAVGTSLICRGTYGERAKGRRRCPSCWYPIRTQTFTCSECGRSVTDEKLFFKTRRSLAMITVGSLILTLSISPFVISRYRDTGVVGFVPTPLLILCLPIVPDCWIRDGSPNAKHDLSLHNRLHQDGVLLELQPYYRDSAAIRILKLSLADPEHVEKYTRALYPPHSFDTRCEFVNIVITALEARDVNQRTAAARVVEQMNADQWTYTNELNSRKQWNLIAGLESRVISLLDSPFADVRRASQDLTMFAEAEVHAVAEHYLRKLQTGHQIDEREWACLAFHSKGHSSARESMNYITPSNLFSAIQLLKRLEHSLLLDEEWLKIAQRCCDVEDHRPLYLLGDLYVFRKIGSDTFAPRFAERIDFSNKDSLSYLYLMVEYGEDAPEALTFIEMAMSSQQFDIQDSAIFYLDLYIKYYPEWTPFARSAALAHMSRYSPRRLNMALDILDNSRRMAPDKEKDVGSRPRFRR